MDGLRLGNTNTGRVVRRFSGGEHGPGRCVAFSIDGKRAISICGRGDSLVLWDTATGDEIRTFVGPSTDEPSLTALAFSPDNRLLLAGDSGGRIVLWDISTATPIHQMASGPGEVTSLSFSPDARFFLSSTFTNLGAILTTITLWEIKAGKVTPAIQL